MKNKAYYDELQRHVNFRTQRIAMIEAEIDKIRKQKSERHCADDVIPALDEIRDLENEVEEDRKYCKKAKSEIAKFYACASRVA